MKWQRHSLLWILQALSQPLAAIWNKPVYCTLFLLERLQSCVLCARACVIYTCGKQTAVCVSQRLSGLWRQHSTVWDQIPSSPIAAKFTMPKTVSITRTTLSITFCALWKNHLNPFYMHNGFKNLIILQWFCSQLTMSGYRGSGIDKHWRLRRRGIGLFDNLISIAM